MSDRARAEDSAGKRDEALRTILSPQAQNTYNAANDPAEADVGLVNAAGASQRQQTIHTGQVLLLTILILMGVSVELCSLIGVTRTRLIAPPLVLATSALERVAMKDLTAQVEETGGSGTRTAGSPPH